MQTHWLSGLLVETAGGQSLDLVRSPGDLKISTMGQLLSEQDAIGGSLQPQQSL